MEQQVFNQMYGPMGCWFGKYLSWEESHTQNVSVLFNANMVIVLNLVIETTNYNTKKIHLSHSSITFT